MKVHGGRDSGQNRLQALWAGSPAGFLLGSLSVGILLAVSSVLILSPGLGLRLLWQGIVPVAPLVFFLAPNLWVSGCPFAFLQSLPRRFGRGGSRRISVGASRSLSVAGWVLLATLVPLRHPLFDQYAAAALAAIVGISLLSLASGFAFEGLSGWCNTLCPVRPVENLYGQFTVLGALPSHCSPCSHCTFACSRIHPRRWPEEKPASRFGYAFPGFVAAFFLAPKNGSLAELYLVHAAGVALSIGFLSACRLFLPHASVARFGALLAISLYYLFAFPGIARAWELPPLAGLVATVLVLTIIAARLTLTRETRP